MLNVNLCKLICTKDEAQSTIMPRTCITGSGTQINLMRDLMNAKWFQDHETMTWNKMLP